MSETYTQDEIETALCVSELLRECAKDPLYLRFEDNAGAWGMRSEIVLISKYVIEVYDLLTLDEKDAGWADDWEIIPEILGTITWASDQWTHPPAAVAALTVGATIQSWEKRHVLQA